MSLGLSANQKVVLLVCYFFIMDNYAILNTCIIDL